MSQVSESGTTPWQAVTDTSALTGHPDALVAPQRLRPTPPWSPDQEVSVPWTPLRAASLYTASPVRVIPVSKRIAPPTNTFGVASVLVSLLAYVVPAAAYVGIDELNAMADRGAELRVGVAFFFLLAYGFALAVPLALVAVVLAAISLKVKNRRRRLGIIALVLAGIPLLAALVISLGFISSVPLPV